MALDRKTSVGVGLGLMALVAVTYQQVCPKVADLRVSLAQHPEAVKSEKQARWTAGGMVVAVSLITKDPVVFIMGASAMISYSWLHRFAAANDPTSQTTQFAPVAPVNMHAGDGAASGYTPGIP